jgi:hypothetical protein
MTVRARRRRFGRRARDAAVRLRHGVLDARHIITAGGDCAKVEDHPCAAGRFGADIDDSHGRSFNTSPAQAPGGSVMAGQDGCA